jgi:hypothetical protein
VLYVVSKTPSSSTPVYALASEDTSPQPKMAGNRCAAGPTGASTTSPWRWLLPHVCFAVRRNLTVISVLGPGTHSHEASPQYHYQTLLTSFAFHGLCRCNIMYSLFPPCPSRHLATHGRPSQDACSSKRSQVSCRQETLMTTDPNASNLCTTHTGSWEVVPVLERRGTSPTSDSRCLNGVPSHSAQSRIEY